MRTVKPVTGPSRLATQVRDLLEELMIEQDLSAKQLGKRSEVQDTTILLVLKGQMIPSLEVVDKLFAGLGHTVSLDVAPSSTLSSSAIIKGMRR